MTVAEKVLPQVAIFTGPGEAKGAVPTSHEAAQFDCIHLVRVVVKLLPTWLPDALFEVLQVRWNSRQRLTRYTFIFMLLLEFCHGLYVTLSYAMPHSIPS